MCTMPMFAELQHKPMLVDLTVEEGTRLKVLYGSQSGFHAVDLDSARWGTDNDTDNVFCRLSLVYYQLPHNYINYVASCYLFMIPCENIVLRKVYKL